METLISGSGASVSAADDLLDDGMMNAEDKELDVIDTDEINELTGGEIRQKTDGNDNEGGNEIDEDNRKKTPVWKKPQKKKQAKKQDKNAGKQKQKSKQKPKATDPASQGDNAQAQVSSSLPNIKRKWAQGGLFRIAMCCY